MFWRMTAALAGLLLFAATAELLTRALHPTPRVQVVRAETPGLREAGGQPLWRVGGAYADALENRACADPNSVDVVLAGDSILYVADEVGLGGGTEREADARLNVSHLLQRAWEHHTPRRCLINVSQPGFRPAQQARVAWEAHAALGADLIVMGVWKGDEPFTQVGQDWYALSAYRLGAAGLPRPLGLPLPAPAERWLFLHSAAWQSAALTLGTRASDLEPTPIGAYVAFMDHAVATRTRVILVEFPPLDQPFEQASARRIDWFRRAEAEAQARAIPYVILADLLHGVDVAEVRLDTCCHFNNRGHEVLAEALGPMIDRSLSAQPP